MNVALHSLNTSIETILKEVDYVGNPYFISLKNGSFEKTDFLETQMRFFHAVEYFNRPMAAMCAKIPSTEQRTPIARNVWEEHGCGNLEKSHAHTFLTLLNRLGGVTPETILRRAIAPEIQIFNSTLMDVCLHSDHLTGASQLGIIERMFSDISRWIGRGIVERGWMPASEMIHYDLHEVIDVQHAQDFFKILETPWNESDIQRNHITQNLRSGARLFDDLYRALYLSRKKRL